jgi:hypothetical protein
MADIKAADSEPAAFEAGHGVRGSRFEGRVPMALCELDMPAATMKVGEHR